MINTPWSNLFRTIWPSFIEKTVKKKTHKDNLRYNPQDCHEIKLNIFNVLYFLFIKAPLYVIFKY